MLDVCRSILRDRARAVRGAALLLAAAAAVGSVATPAAADTYRYDVLGRLTRVTYTNGAVVYYVYDAAGNRTTVIADPTGSTPPPAAVQAPAAPKDNAGATTGAPPVEAAPAPAPQGEASPGGASGTAIRPERSSER